MVAYTSEDINEIVDYVRKLEAGMYIIQKCETDSTKNIQTYHTRVSF